MGGNVKIGSYRADRIEFTKESLGALKNSIYDMLCDLEFDYDASELLYHPDFIPFSGSSKYLMEDPLIYQYKTSVGDIDIQIHESKRDKLQVLLEPGKVYGTYEVVGTKAHGNELSALMRTGTKIHQFDFQFSAYPGTVHEMFLHSSPLEDLKLGISGVYHKLMINALGLDKYKFSITHGLRLREGNENCAKSVMCYYFSLFPEGAQKDWMKLESLVGCIELINMYRRNDKSKIFYKFIESVDKAWNVELIPEVKALLV